MEVAELKMLRFVIGVTKMDNMWSCIVLCTGQHSNGVKRSGMGRMV